MKKYLEKITLNKNSRGCYILDTVKGCKYNCYNECYAKKIAERYGYNFAKTVNRNFIRNEKQLYMFGFYDNKHENKICLDIEKIDMPFVRIGEMGDPSFDWQHTVNICSIISKANKFIVIVTKHWNKLNIKQLKILGKLNVCINTSISALDNYLQIKRRLKQFKIIGNYCKSILRIVSCDFNKDNKRGVLLSHIQEKLFKNNNVIDTIFRVSMKNKLVLNKVINTERVLFLKSKVNVSRYNKDTFFGYCNDCVELCGINK